MLMEADIPPDLLRAELERELRYRRLELYRPYAKQLEFHAAGATFRERGFLAGNQLGKTLSGGAECAYHLTGRYPSWWPGRRWNRPTVGWAASVSGETTRDNVQRILLGRTGEFGTGYIPADAIKETMAARGVPDGISAIRVQHVNGGTSTVLLKSYERGREAWQGDTIDWLWMDEEPPPDIYGEGLTRTNATGGMTMLTATPLLGMTSVMGQFYPRPTTAERHLTQMTIEDAEHYSPEQRAKIVAAYPEHEREARAKGIPMLGSGRVFPVAESAIKETGIALPRHWPRICGIDFGHGDHPTAAAWLAWDRDSDVVHVTDGYRNRDPGILLHAGAIRARGDWIPVAWPADGLQSDRVSSETVAGHYRKAGVALLAEHATHPDGGIGVEAGVVDMLERMRTGRLKVAEHLEPWFEEFRLYHRKDGKIVKVLDDLLSATRYGIMMLRHARLPPELRAGRAGNAGGSSYDVLSW